MKRLLMSQGTVYLFDYKFLEIRSVEFANPVGIRSKPQFAVFVFINRVNCIAGQTIFGGVIRQVVAIIFPNACVNRTHP